MDIINLIRSIIFFVAALVVFIFADQLMWLQDKVLTKLHVKYRDSKKALNVLGIIFLVISLGLFIYAVSN
jgi:hypothetical protein